MLFLENEAQINRNNYRTMLLMSKQVSLLKISLTLQKMKIGQKIRYTPFLHKALQLQFVVKAESKEKIFFHTFYWTLLKGIISVIIPNINNLVTVFQILGFQILDSRFQILDSRSQIQDSVIYIPDSTFQI